MCAAREGTYNYEREYQEQDTARCAVQEDPPLDSILWACTLAAGPQNSQLERHYSTYVIYSTGLWAGAAIPSHHKLYRPYMIMDEFSGIAFHLICLDKFEGQFREMWFEAFQIALENWRKETAING